jgi:short-subunit dehydrogenase
MKKTILITGASSGIGKVTAERLITEGHKVYCAARRVEKMKDLEEQGGVALEMDVTKHDSVKNAVEKIISEQEKIDVLFNNAGFGLYGAVEDIPLDDVRYQFEVNLFGLADVTKQVLPHMREQKSGTIINTSSMGGKIYTPMGAWYHATKHALEGWSDCLRLELKQFNIDVVIIEPGVIKTEFSDNMAGPMLKYSKDTAYGDLASKMAKANKDTYSNRLASSPKVIASLVSKAVNARRPRTRYVAGYLARPMMFLRKWFGDRIFDRVLMSIVR